MPKSKKEERYEDVLVRLEAVVADLEKGGQSLEDSLKLFEEGQELLTRCNSMLDDAQKRMDMLVMDGDKIHLQRINIETGEALDDRED